MPNKESHFASGSRAEIFRHFDISAGRAGQLSAPGALDGLPPLTVRFQRIGRAAGRAHAGRMQEIFFISRCSSNTFSMKRRRAFDDVASLPGTAASFDYVDAIFLFRQRPRPRRAYAQEMKWASMPARASKYQHTPRIASGHSARKVRQAILASFFNTSSLLGPFPLWPHVKQYYGICAATFMFTIVPPMLHERQALVFYFKVIFSRHFHMSLSSCDAEEMMRVRAFFPTPVTAFFHFDLPRSAELPPRLIALEYLH